MIGDSMSGKTYSGMNVVDLRHAFSVRSFDQLDSLERYWQGLTGTDQIPNRCDVDPRAIQDLLEYAFIAEEIAPGRARFRISGAHLSEIYGSEVRGLPLSNLIATEHRDQVKSAMRKLFHLPAILDLRLSMQGGLEGRMKVLPLRDDLGRPSMALGALVTRARGKGLSRRFSVDAIRVTELPGREVSTTSDGQPRPERVGPGAYLRLVVEND